MAAIPEFTGALRVAQPFIDTRGEDNRFRSVRAIVCKGEYIDAYTRVSADPVVNLCRGASAQRYDGPPLRELSETIVAEYSAAVQQLPANNWRSVVYNRWGESQPLSTRPAMIQSVRRLK